MYFCFINDKTKETIVNIRKKNSISNYYYISIIFFIIKSFSGVGEFEGFVMLYNSLYNSSGHLIVGLSLRD